MDNILPSAEAVLPQIVADDSHVRSALAVFRLAEHAAQHRPDA